MAKKSILIVDDEAGIRELLQMYLQKKGYDVIIAEDGEQAINLALSDKPNLILLDIEMPGMNGFEVCKRIRKEMTIPILFLSVRRDVMDKVKCFELGGDDFITKPFDYSELEARIKANLRRYQLGVQDQTEDILVYYDLEIHLNNCKCYLDGKLVTMSAKELQLLILLAKYPNRIWSPEQIYDQIWGFDSVGDIQTVKVHISNLRRKLEKDPASPKFIQTVRGFGYLFSTESETL